MTKKIAAVLAACVFFTGCSGVSHESSSSIAEGSNSISPILPTTESDSLLISTISEPQTISDMEREEFNEKCKEYLGYFSMIFDSVQLTEPNVQYDNDDISLSKIYVVKGDYDGKEERILLSFLDIYCEDEYTYFQSLKNFINFIDENAIEISGSDQYAISVNLNKDGDNWNKDIDIMCGESGSGVYSTNILYRNRDIYAAYSDRLKNMEMLKDSRESISFSGLINYDDLPKDVVSYDITVQYEGKNLTHKWYKIEDDLSLYGGINFVTYIDDGTYNDISDEELVYYAYNSIFDPQNDLKKYNSYNFYFAYKSGKEFVCLISYDTWTKNFSYFVWNGQYDYLNSNPLNQELLNELTQGTSE